MDSKTIPEKILKKLHSITSKRPRTVIEHIIKHGHITTEELKGLYNYNHPPRAARDVRELGIPLETFRVKDSTGRVIGAYRFGNWEEFRAHDLRGRHAFPKLFKKQLIDANGNKCHICGVCLEERYLQIDHRVPFEVAGDNTPDDRDLMDFMLLCSSCNRAKSWSCEHCQNWSAKRDDGVCRKCYWAVPLDYQHVAMRDIRRLDLIWQDAATNDYDSLKQSSRNAGIELPDFVRELLRKNLSRKTEE